MMITESSLAPPNPRMGPLGNGGAESSQTDQQEFRTLMNRPESQEESQAGRQRRLAPQKERAETASPLRETHSKVSPERKKETDSAETDHSSKTARVKKGAIRKFMDSLESELGISAERLSAALAQLPAEMKDRPIDETAPLIMQQLGFVDSSDNRAMVDQYLKLADVNGLLGQEKPSVALPERPQLGETLMSDSQGALDISQMKLVDREKLNLRIDDLNRRFFDTQLSATSGAGAQKLAAPLASGMEGIAPQEGLQPSVKTERSVEWNPELQGMEAAEAASMDGLMGGLEQSLPTGSSTLRDFEISLNKSAEKNAGRSWTVEELPYLLGDNSGGLTNNVLGASSKSGQEGDGGMQGFKQDQKSDFVDSRAGSGDLNPMEFSLPFPQGMVEGTQTMNGRTVVQNNSMAPTGLDQSANVEKIKTAAESLATQGGGEVKVILQPEGLGTVQLKVRMHEGKIQVQMKADNQESQKLLESSLTDLRQSLSNQKIAVDSVKVDVGGDLTRQDQSNQFASQNFDQGREQARQFMSQFRQENFFNRQPMFDAPGFKSYRSQREDSINPVAENIRPRSSTARGTGREINVVA